MTKADSRAYHGWKLYSREVTSKEGVRVTIFFFSRRKPKIGRRTKLPRGLEVSISKRTKLPSLTKRKRVFLTRVERSVFEEWGVPVRYISSVWREHLGRKCTICGGVAETAAHRIPYQKGILDFGLTPEYLNRWSNLTATCRQCNKKAELSYEEIRSRVAALKKRVFKSGDDPQ